MTSYDLSASAVVPGTIEQAYDAVVSSPLERLLGRRSGPIPPVVRTEGEGPAPWGSSIGQARTIVLGDGGRLLETLVEADRPAAYGYRLTEVRGPMRPLVRSVDGRFTFVAEAGDTPATRVTWSWRLHLTAAPVRLLMPVFGVFWRRSARDAFAQVAELT
jgi:hypothetical protein